MLSDHTFSFPKYSPQAKASQIIEEEAPSNNIIILHLIFFKFFTQKNDKAS